MTGGAEWQTRLLPALFAVLFVPAVYALTRRLFGPRAAGFAVLLCAIHPLLLSYGQIIRYYTFVATLAALSNAAFVGILRGRASRRDWIVHFIATSGLLLSDYPAYAVLLAQNLMVIVALLRRSRVPLRGWAIAHAVWLVMCVPLAAAALLQGARDFGVAELSTGIVGHVLKIAYAGFAWSIGEYLFPWRVAALLGLAASVALLAMAAQRPSLALLAAVARDSLSTTCPDMSAFAPLSRSAQWRARCLSGPQR
jgi:4-amino-4-deoxy-L-arabinose transferase-like glycosyltransferase